LGLAVTYGITLSHKGFIEVESRSGKGTSFFLYFPAYANSTDEQDARPEAKKSVPGGHETVLIFEEEELLRSLVRELLSRAGYSTLEAATSEEALALFRSRGGAIDLVLMDLGQPGGPNERLFDQLKAIRPSVKVILSTGQMRREGIEELARLKAHGMIHKPYAVAEMLEAVRKVLDDKRDKATE
jgi:DNA-binding NtrC family response regulator